jgi:hypothetical protein
MGKVIVFFQYSLQQLSLLCIKTCYYPVVIIVVNFGHGGLHVEPILLYSQGLEDLHAERMPGYFKLQIFLILQLLPFRCFYRKSNEHLFLKGHQNLEMKESHKCKDPKALRNQISLLRVKVRFR